MRRGLAVVLALMVTGCGVTIEPSAKDDSPAPEPSVVILVRHAEALYPPPEDAPRNPPLNAMGQDRADALARLLSSEPLDSIFSTDYHRTQETAAPLAALLGLTVQSYDPSDLESFAGRLTTTPGRHLVVGHSNTTPELVEWLGGAAGEPIDEAMEFDRLYLLIVDGSGEVTTIVERYGTPVLPDWRERAAIRR